MAEPHVSSDRRPVIHVCQTCRSGGEALHDALVTLADPSQVTITGVRCLAACSHANTATLSMPGKWSWLLGRLTPDLAADLLVYVRAYEQSQSGTVMPSRRPESLRDVILGRFPAAALPDPVDSAVTESVS